MPEQMYNLTEAIQMAIDLERNGRQYYLKAADLTHNESGKKIFQVLAEEESLHLATFKKMLSSMQELKDWRELVKDYPEPRQAPVFDKDRPIEQRAKARTDEIEALRLAMEQERKAIDFFEQVVNNAENELVREVFKFVLDQEHVHLALLQAEYDSIVQTGFWFDTPEFRMDGKF
ncbi:hypothetical protein GF406_19855 [candidate division KSB1 bacterium]|jgi:rubrerythrin|nr:hypothetical protein [candidate division KSB1 bacterium]